MGGRFPSESVAGFIGMRIKDLALKTKRGQSGRINKGRAAGGLAYGYRVKPGVEAGDREIIEEEAEIIRHIFTAYAAGESPRVIARTLNDKQIPGPGGRPWGDTTIRGQVDRGTGLLNNSLYVGRLEWNRCSYIKDPATGKRVARPNPPEDWQVTDVPHLRIIGQDLWERVKARQTKVHRAMGRDELGNALNRAHRKKYLLSGLLLCHHCGHPYTISGKDSYGCNTHRSKGTCPNDRTVDRLQAEARIFDGLQHRLLAPELVSEFIKAFREEVLKSDKQRHAQRRANQKQLNTVISQINQIIRAIEDGMYNPSMKDRMTNLEARKADLQGKLTKAEPEDKDLLPMLPDLSDLFHDKIAHLTEALNDPAIRSEAFDLIRSMIDKIVVVPNPAWPDDHMLEIHGAMAEILALCAGQTPNRKTPAALAAGVLPSVVAGIGFEPMTFRL
ncbi:recombinase family protein [Magnetospira thiophila]